MCFCPDLSIALKKCSLNNDFIKTISSALDLKAKRISNSNKVATNLAKHGHIVKLFSEFVDSKNAINLKLDLRNFALLKAMQSFLSTTTTIDNRHGNNYFSTIMLNAMECALDYCDKHGVPNDLSNNTRYTINESYELLVNMLSSIAEGDEFLFQNISERTFL